VIGDPALGKKYGKGFRLVDLFGLIARSFEVLVDVSNKWEVGLALSFFFIFDVDSYDCCLAHAVY
jgi:hypothetical protein